MREHGETAIVKAPRSPRILIAPAAYLRKACDFGDRSRPATTSPRRWPGSPKGAAPGTPTDPAEAARLFERLCSRGDPVGCYNRAVMFINGQGERQSYQAAVPWLKKACTPKYKSGCDTLQELRDKRSYAKTSAASARSAAASAPPSRLRKRATPPSYAGGSRTRSACLFPILPTIFPVSARNLCNASDVQANASGDSMLVAGRLAIGALPYGIAARPSAPDSRESTGCSRSATSCRRTVSAKWAGEVIGSRGRLDRGPRHGAERISRLVIDKPKTRGDALLIVVSGDPISVAKEDQGGAVILGSYLRPL